MYIPSAITLGLLRLGLGLGFSAVLVRRLPALLLIWRDVGGGGCGGYDGGRGGSRGWAG